MAKATETKPQDEQKYWAEQLDYARKCRKAWFESFEVQKSREYYYGKQLPPGENPNEFITINKIYSHLQTQLPTLYSIDPYFYVKLKKSFDPSPQALEAYEANGRIRQGALNYYKTELGLKDRGRLAILDAHFAYGVIKTRYCADEKPHPKAKQPIVSESGGKVLKDDNDQPLTYPETVPVNERFEILRIHPDDLVFGDDSGPLEYSWPFIAERVRMTRAQAKTDKTLNQEIVKNVKGYKQEPENEEAKSFWSVLKETANQSKPKETDLLIFWEIYDLHHKKWLKLCEGASELAMKPTDLPKGVEKHPYSILRFSLTDDGPYPLPPISQAVKPQDEYNLARSKVLKHRKRFNRKYEVNKSLLESEAELSKLESGDDGTIISVNQAGAVQPIQDASIDQTTYTEIALLNNDLVEIFGTPNNARGVSDTDSATEASLQDKYLGIREGDRMSSVTDWLIDIGRKLDMLIKAHMDKTMAVKIVGPRGEEWVTLTPEAYQDIQGEYEYSVNVGATKPRIPEIERSQWLAFLQVVVQFPHILTAPAFMKRMAEMHGIEDESAIEELRRIGLKIMSGQMPMPGGGGSQPGATENNPIAAALGTALGPIGGNVNGGGSPQSASVQ